MNSLIMLTSMQVEGHEEHSPYRVYLRSTVLTSHGVLDLGEGEVRTPFP